MSQSSKPPDAIAAIMQARTQSLTAVVYEELERRILAGELRGGERFNEQSLAHSLGVSRGPVREARRFLEHAGFVVAIPGRGTFVRKLEQSELGEIYDIRALLTGFACARIATSGTSKQATALQRLVRKMDDAIAAPDEARYYALNIEFHDVLMDSAGHKRAAQLYQDHVKETHLSRQMALSQQPRMKESNAEHAAIVEAILAGDSDRARAAGESHVLNGKRRWIEATKQDKKTKA